MTESHRIILCEKGNRWAIALRGALHGHAVRVYETRHWAAAVQCLDRDPADLIAVELRRSNLTEVVRGIADVRRQFPEAATIVLAERSLRDCEWTVREAGALHFTTSPRHLDPVARLAVRHLGAHHSTASGPAEAIRQRLPWQD